MGNKRGQVIKMDIKKKLKDIDNHFKSITKEELEENLKRASIGVKGSAGDDNKYMVEED